MKRKVSTKKIIILIVAAVIILPVVSVGVIAGGFAYSCNTRISAIDNKASEVNQKLEHLSIPTSSRSAKTNGDCLTASGVGFGFSVQKTYVSPLAAKNDIISSLTSVGIPAPDIAQEPEYIFAQDGSSSGGDTPIKEIELTYRVDGSASYSFVFTLEEAIPCEVISAEKVRCNGKDKDDLLNELIKSQPISSTDFHGSVRYD